jgi:hypothetical protein
LNQNSTFWEKVEPKQPFEKRLNQNQPKRNQIINKFIIIFNIEVRVQLGFN